MPTFAFRILPPRAAFWDTIEPDEVVVLARYLQHLRRLKEEGTVRFVGRTEGATKDGDYGFMLIEAEDPAHAGRIARSDPAVAEGLMRVVEVSAFMVVFGGDTALETDQG